MRGKDRSTFTASRPERITPAYAGKSALSCSSCPCGWDHPRVCGEKALLVLYPVLLVGSPPRVRGKESRPHRSSGSSGITPACAGKSAIPCFWPLPHWDHPRVCGEKYSTRPYLSDEWGSPPRVRGKVTSLIPALPLHGITPACAGKSGTTRRKAGNKWDHPRVCGEKRRDRLDYYVPQGSPPRVRGKGAQGRPSPGHPGITPACAGKSAAAPLVSTPARDHPRVCGEKTPLD